MYVLTVQLNDMPIETYKTRSLDKAYKIYDNAKVNGYHVHSFTLRDVDMLTGVQSEQHNQPQEYYVLVDGDQYVTLNGYLTSNPAKAIHYTTILVAEWARINEQIETHHITNNVQPRILMTPSGLITPHTYQQK